MKIIGVKFRLKHCDFSLHENVQIFSDQCTIIVHEPGNKPWYKHRIQTTEHDLFKKLNSVK